MAKNEKKLEVVAKTDTGSVRTANEDNFIVTDNSSHQEWIVPRGEYINSEEGTVLVVSDGMGGLNAGEVASKIAIDSIKEYLTEETTVEDNNKKVSDILERAIIHAHAEIVKHSIKFPETEGMGCTVIIALLKDNSAHIAWVGDSRCYVWRRGKLLQLSKDHSFVQTLVDNGKITKEQAFYHPESNIITQSLGASERKPKPDYIAFTLSDEDIIMLCSDGLSGMLKDEMIESVLTDYPVLSSCVDVLIDQANKEGGTDNITVLLAKVIGDPDATISKTIEDRNDSKNRADDRKPFEQVKKKMAYKPTLILISLIIVLGLLSLLAVPHFRKAQPHNNKKKDNTVIKDSATAHESTQTNNTNKKESIIKKESNEKEQQKTLPAKTKTTVEEALKNVKSDDRKKHSDTLTPIQKKISPEPEKQKETDHKNPADVPLIDTI